MVDAHADQQFVEIDVLGVDLEPKFSHDHLEFILELLVLKRILLEVTTEDGVHEDLVPTHSALLLDLQAFRQEILSFRLEVFIDLQRLGLDILDKLELSVCRPGGFSVKQLIEDEADGPDIALGSVRLRLEDLDGHVEGRTDRGCIFDAFSYVFFGEPKVSNLNDALTEHNVRWLKISA
jgi:hypothetical protein